MIHTDPAAKIEDPKAIQPVAWFKSRMTSHNLLVTVLTASCVVLSAANHDNPTTRTYPAKVFNTTQGECPSDLQRDMVIAEVKEDIRNLLIRVYRDCKDALTQGQTTSGVYTIQPDNQPAFLAYCDMETDSGGWTVFQRRMDGSVDFYRNWTDYQQGFGSLSGEFWLGLDKIHRLTTTPAELRVDMRDFEGNSAYAQYTSFSVGDSASKYILSVSGYSGTAGDDLAYHNGRPFSTRDQQNDAGGHDHICAQTYKGAWWYVNCHRSNLNGLYHGGAHSSAADGVNWYTWKGFYYSLKFTEMKVRQ